MFYRCAQDWFGVGDETKGKSDRFMRKRYRIKGYLFHIFSRIMMIVNLVQILSVMITISLQVGNLKDETVYDGDPLDAFQCLHLPSYQMTKKFPMVKRVNYDLTHTLEILISVRDELNSLDVKHYQNEPGVLSLIESSSIKRALLFGKPVSWTLINSTLVSKFSADHRLILDLIRIVSDKDRDSGLCLIDRKEVDHSMCQNLVKLNVGNIKTKYGLDIAEPSYTVETENVGRPDILSLSRSAFNWLTPSSAPSHVYLTQSSHVTELLFHLEDMIDHQLVRIIKKLRPFMIHAKAIERCNPFLFDALNKVRCDSSQSEPCVSEQVVSECRQLTLSLGDLDKDRSGRGLLSWLFLDQEESINNLIKAQHKSVKAEEIIVRNQLVLESAAKALNENLKSLKTTDEVNSEKLLELIATVETRETLHNVDRILAQDKLQLISFLRDINSQLSDIEREFNLMIQRLISDLLPLGHCSQDPKNRGISCSTGLSFIETYNQGQLSVASMSELYGNTQVYVISCLFLDPQRHSLGALFRGNQNGFLKRDSFFHHKNLSVPSACFQNLNAEGWNCQDFIATYVEGSDVRPPLQIGPIHYIVGPDFAFLQSLTGTLTLTLDDGRSLPLGPQPLLIKEIQFPVFVNARKIEFFELILAENVSLATEFFLKHVDSNYFYFKLPALKTTKLASSTWSEYWLDLEEYFVSNPVIKAVSISSLVIVGLLFFFCALGIFLCCRRRGDQSRLAEVVYTAVKQKNQPSRPPKPSAETVGPVHRNTKERLLSIFKKEKKNPDADPPHNDAEDPLVQGQA